MQKKPPSSKKDGNDESGAETRPKPGEEAKPQKSSTNVSVVCRVRPFNEKEKELIRQAQASGDPRNRETCVDFNPDDKTLITVFTPNDKQDKDPFEKHAFNLDYVFECETDQATVYNVGAKPIVDGILEGFNGTVLAYGQTSSGKTFTMQGILESPVLCGIIPRMVETIFEAITRSSQNVEFTVKAAMIEIYNEKIRDLLDPSKDNLNVHEDKQRGIYVDGLTEISIGDAPEIYELMKDGNGNRAIAETKMNAQSSRSHSIFILTLTMNDQETLVCKTGKLYLVDLAGSEMISKTGASGQTLEEAKNINKSLTMLGRVITALTDGKSAHIPYRDSKLTRILQDSLGGNSKTCLIITASPSMYNAAETLSTCRFGVRAKSIKNNAKVNKQVTLAELKLVINGLEKELTLKAQRITRLETVLISKGLTLESIDDTMADGDEPERLTTDESTEGKESVGGEPSKESSGGMTPSPTKEDTPTSMDGVNKEEEKKAGEKMESAAVMKLYNQMEQQRDMIEKPMLEKKNEEQGRDIDTLINQLREERKRARAKDKRIKDLQRELAALSALRSTEAEKVHDESQELALRLKEQERMIEDLKRGIRESQTAAKGGVDKSGMDFLAKVLSDLELDPQTRDRITLRASQLACIQESTTPAEKTSTIFAVSTVPLEDYEKLQAEKEELGKSNDKLKLEVAELNTKLNEMYDCNKRKLETNSIGTFKRKITVLEKNMEQLSKLYYDHINKMGAMKLELQFKSGQLARKSQKVEDYEKQIGKLKEDFKFLKMQTDELKAIIWENVPNASEILAQPIFSQNKPFYLCQGNVVKSIRGGGGMLLRRNMSIIPAAFMDSGPLGHRMSMVGLSPKAKPYDEFPSKL